MSQLPQHQTAAIFTEYGGEFKIDHQFAIPQVESDCVLVRNLYASVNPVDYKIKIGIYKWVQSFPKVLGVDASGEVVAIGQNVTKFKVGDLVSGPTFKSGTYSQYVLFAEKDLALKPKELSHEVASADGVIFLTSFQACQKDVNASKGERGSLKGRRVLVIGGSSGTGSAAILLAKHYFNADQVVSVASQKNLEYVKDLGADVVLDYTLDSFRESLKQYEHAFDLIIDTVGSYSQYFDLPLSREGGVFVTIAGDLPTESGSTVFGTEKYSFHAMQGDGASLQSIYNWLAESGLWSKIPIVGIYKLEQASKAHEQIATQRTVGKILLEIPHNQ